MISGCKSVPGIGVNATGIARLPSLPFSKTLPQTYRNPRWNTRYATTFCSLVDLTYGSGRPGWGRVRDRGTHHGPIWWYVPSFPIFF